MSSLKTAVITGGNVGIGFNAAGKLLARGGFELILAVRNMQRGNEAADKLRAAHPSAVVSVMQCDVASLKSVREFADAFKANKQSLHLLILNAGIFAGEEPTPKYTTDGFELTFGTNHVGHFYLTELLLPVLRASAPSRVVVTSSMLHNYGHLDPSDWQMLENGAKVYTGSKAYNNSKLANVLFARELQRRESPNGVTANAIHPGWIPSSEFMRSYSSAKQTMVRTFIQPIGRVLGFVQTLDQGGDATMAGAFAAEGGLYFNVTKQATSSAESRNEELAKQLWDYTEGLIAKAGEGKKAEE